MSSCVCALSVAAPPAVLEVPAASKTTSAPGFFRFTAAVMPWTALTCFDGSPE